MKITKTQLRKIITEELDASILDQQLDSSLEDLVSTFGKQAQVAVQKGKGEEEKLEEVAILTAAGIALVIPALMKMISGAARIVNIGIKKMSKGGDKSAAVKAFADWMEGNGEKLHHKYISVFTAIAKNVFRIEDDEDAERVGKAMYYLLIAALAVTSGVGAAHAAEHAHIPMASLETALTAIKGGELQLYLSRAVPV